MAQKISQMTEQTTASMTEAGTSDFLGGYTATGGNANRKFSLSGLANYFLNKFKMTLGGSSQTVKSAIDTLNSKVVVSSTINTLPTNPVAGAYFVSAGDSSFPTNFGMLEIKKVSTTNSSEFVGLYYGTPTANARRIYMNYYHANLGGWQGWFTTASQADVDSLNSKVTLTKNATGISGWSNNNSANLTVETATKIFVISIDADKSISGNIIDKS